MLRGGLGLRDLDAFRPVDVEFSNASTGGGVLTLLAVCCAVVLGGVELSALMYDEVHSELALDASPDSQLRIYFNITFHDLACEHLSIGVRDSLQTNRMNVGRGSVELTDIDHEGKEGHPYTDEEVFLMDHEQVAADRMAELEADWTSLADDKELATRHDLEETVNAHDFVFVMYYVNSTARQAIKCPPCRRLFPVFAEFEKQLNNGEGTARVKAMRLNCVDYAYECLVQNITRIPQLRLYKRGPDAMKKYDTFYTEKGIRKITVANLTDFLSHRLEAAYARREEMVHHNMFQSSCRAAGYVDVAKVPGTLHFEAAHSEDANLNFALTNISHTIHHLSFGDGAYGVRALDFARQWYPREYTENVHPLDGRAFVATEFHHAPHHYINVVATHLQREGGSLLGAVFSGGLVAPPLTTHQMTHQMRIATVPHHQTPSARFTYDLSPVEAHVAIRRGRPFYDVITTVFALVGGVFSVASIVASLSRQMRG